MWNDDGIRILPRSKQNFFVSSYKNDMYFIKPGQFSIYKKKDREFEKIKETPKISGKIEKVVISPCGSCSLHLPKKVPHLAFHENSKNGIVFVISFPAEIEETEINEDILKKVRLTSGKYIYLTLPQEELKVGGPCQCCSCCNSGENDFFSNNVQGMAISEFQNVIVVAYKEDIWVWQQFSEEIIGCGYWTQLNENQELKISTNAVPNIWIDKKYRRSSHGFMKPQQAFSLSNPNTSPIIPENSPVVYQDLCVFRNPCEGTGLCFLTMILPPYRPFETLYIFNSICYIKEDKTIYERRDLTIPIIEGYGGPCVWWSVDCRFLVIAVSKSIIILTRYLVIISIVPISSIFIGQESLIADVSWSCQGEFFLVTSYTGQIGVVTRCGKTMKHELCSLEHFDHKFKPLLVTADSSDPSLFNIYSPSSRKMRQLKIDLKKIPRDLQVLMSLQFPQTSVAKLYNAAVDAIKKNGASDRMRFIKLLYYTAIFRIFPYMSPLRYYLVPLFEEGSLKALEDGDDIFTYFVVRCIMRISGITTKAYLEIHRRLSKSKHSKDHVLYKILDDELNHRDYTVTKVPLHHSIKVYSKSQSEITEKIPPHHGLNADIIKLIEIVTNVLYHNDFFDLSLMSAHLKIFADLLIHLDQPSKALMVSKNISDGIKPAEFFVKICIYYANSAPKLYAALMACIEQSPEDEDDLRGVCLKAMINIIKQKISELVPIRNDKNRKYISQFAILEKELEFVIPTKQDQLDDFGVIYSIALCVATYKYCMYYLTGKSEKTPELLRSAIKELFQLLWFIQWRFLAIYASGRSSIAKEALLRLFAFPDFINVLAAKSQLDSIEDISKEVCNLYMDNNPDPEKDPYYSNFLESCMIKLDPIIFSKVSFAALRFCKVEKDIPYSGLLIAAIISHMVPWLRCAIPRAISKFRCYEKVPNELLNFEEYHFPSEVQEEEEEDIYSYSESIDYSYYSSSYRLSDGEYQGSTKNATIVKQIDPKEVTPDKPIQNPKKSKHEKKPKKAKAPTPDTSKKKDKKMPSQPKVFPVQQPQQIIPLPTPIYYPQMAPTVIYKPIENPYKNEFTPIWDFSPSDFVVPEPEPEKKEEVKPTPVYVDIYTEPVKYPPTTKNAETQFEPPPPPRKVKPLVKKYRRKIEPVQTEKPFDFSMSSTESEVFFGVEPFKDSKAEFDPFPLDDGLHKKIEDLINDMTSIPDAQNLPSKPEFSPTKHEIHIPSLDDFQIDKSKYDLPKEDEEFQYYNKKLKAHPPNPTKKAQIAHEVQINQTHTIKKTSLKESSKPKSTPNDFKEVESLIRPHPLKKKKKRTDTSKTSITVNKPDSTVKRIDTENFLKDLSKQKVKTSLKEIDSD